MKKTFSLQELDEIADFLLGLKKTRVFAFKGNLGSGKTTLIKALAQKLGISEGELSSPTFGIINIYENPEVKIYHIDLYRLKNLEEARALGISEILNEAEENSGTYVFIEWFEIIEPLLRNYYEISLQIQAETLRLLEINLYETEE